jgi:hypothetical protein
VEEPAGGIKAHTPEVQSRHALELGGIWAPRARLAVVTAVMKPLMSYDFFRAIIALFVRNTLLTTCIGITPITPPYHNQNWKHLFNVLVTRKQTNKAKSKKLNLET